MTLPRTDLALELAQERTAAGASALPCPGIHTEEETRWGCPITRLHIVDRPAAEALHRPEGRYVTIDLRPALARQERLGERPARCLAACLRPLLPMPGPATPFLVAGLGNDAMTPDAVGPLALRHLLVTRHLPRRFAALTPVAALRPGVLAQTGLETVELLRGAVSRLRPAAVIVIDALAARSRHRLCATVQLSDTGLVPGSGVGNHRRGLDRHTLGVPVVAIGVPTVIDGAALAGEDAPPTGLFVTPQDIDRRVAALGELIGTGVTLALQPSLTREEIGALLE